MAAPVTSLHLWIRQGVFVLVMVAMAWGYIHLAHRNIVQMVPPPTEAVEAPPESEETLAPRGPDLSRLTVYELRHYELTLATQRDLQPDFTTGVSEPLKKLAPHRTNGLAQPLWPWVAAWMLDEKDPATLQELSWFRVGLTLSCVILLGLFCSRYFTLPAALLVVALTAFHGLLGTVTVYSGATLFHLLFLLTWLGCLYALQRNSLWVYGLIGVSGSLAYLAMDRILPLLVVFVLISTLRAVWGWMAAHWCPHEGTTLWVRSNHMFGLLLLVTGIGFIAGPRLTEAHRQYGDATFQYIDHVRWLDTREEARAWIDQHPDKASLQKEPMLSRPSPQNYFHSHTPEQIRERLFSGLSSFTSRLQGRGGEAVTVLLGLLTAFAIACRVFTPKACHAGERLHPETVPTVLFIVSVAVAYGGIAAWDLAVIPANHLHALIGPMTLSLLWGCESVLRRARRRGARRALSYGYQGVLWILLGMTLWQFWQDVSPQALP